MLFFTPMKLIVVGFGLLVLGVILPFAMVTHALESTLFLNFFAYLSSVIGLVLGFLGLVLHAGSRRRDRD